MRQKSTASSGEVSSLFFFLLSFFLLPSLLRSSLQHATQLQHRGQKYNGGDGAKENNFILSNNYFERKFLFYFERKFLFLATIISWSPCGNSAPFVTRELKKAIYTRTRLKNKFNKFPTNLNERNYKKQRNKCVSLRKKAIKQHFKKVTAGGLISNSDFWNLVKPFLSNKGGLVGDDISLVHNNQIVTDDSELTEIFNNHYINIVEKTSGQKPCNISDTVKYDYDRLLVRLILEKYKDHPSVLAIREGSNTSNSFSFHEVQHHEVWALLRSLDGKKFTGEDHIPPKLVHLAADELTAPLTFAINSCLQNQRFQDKGKRAAVCHLDKGEENRTAEKNFRPVSVLNTFSKIYEKVMKQQLIVYLDTTLSVFIGAYRLEDQT